MQDQNIPYGYCECGCGEKTPIATTSRPKRGIVAGQPTRFLPSHNMRSAYAGYEERDCGYQTPCWVWLGNISPNGYARRNTGRGSSGVHIQFWTATNGPVPDGLQLDHLCRNRACVNPDHLEPVTGTENVRRGLAAKLTTEAVHEIRSSSETPRALAERFGVSRSAIYMVRNSRGWEDVTPTTYPEGRSVRTKLTAADVREIRASDDSPLTLAERYGMSRAGIYSILHRRTWKGLS